ncbi:hypothetical protein [Streptomyces sp. AK010]|uniref:hypothetical protein n=1 Tax=Streptomyces sp. AK010 TaxID=2723074 RepID=UPI0016188C5F|nr:hypothetical protein [Streptomyces sp. AK010]MBB6421921.1 2-keto-4-pentenoate hydratase/2-oxohepta-3-ene-1,7-dioic acid hydratase in catechol pathway [Streptomyces sp. AK010]
MKFIHVGPAGCERPVLVAENDRAYDLRPLTSAIDGPFLEDDGIERARTAFADGLLPEIDIVDERIGAPIARPGKIVCIGLNYRDHAAETGAEVPTRPVVFLKAP